MGFHNNTPLRRSTRRRKVPVSYAALEEDQMEDIKPTLLPAQQQEQQLKETLTCHSNSMGSAKLGSQSTAAEAYIITGGAPSVSTSGSPRSYSKLQETESSDDSDGEYGVKPKKKKPKTVVLHERVFVGNAEDKEEKSLRLICSSLGIDPSLFDDWVEDPRLKDVSKMNIPFMPNEIMMEIFGHCRSEVLVQCERSCQRFQDLLIDNTRIWRQARLLYYPGLDLELPYNLDEFSLFELATEKKCDYCESEKTRPYYAWGIRSCYECIKSLTMCISEFRKMLKKKCDDEEDWTPYRREQVCNAIHWHRNPNYSKICWKEYAYNLIEDAEDEMLAGTFDSWIKTKQVSRPGVKTRRLERWGSDISGLIEADRRGDEERVRKLRKSCYHDWCMRLPRPIPLKTLEHIKAYGAFCRISSYPTKSEFIRQLPKLIVERDYYEENERKKEELKALYRIQQDSVLDRACSDIIQQVIEKGPISPLSWCTILQKAVQKVGKTQVKIKVPRGTPLAVYTKHWDWKHDWDSNHLMRLIDILEEKLYLHPNTSASESLLHPASYEFFNNGEDRVFGCPAALEPSSSTPCKRKDVMDFRELVSHMVSHKIDLQYYWYIWMNPHNVIVVHPAIKQNRPITMINGREYRQRELQFWFRPLPEMTELDCSAGWTNSRYSGVFKAIMKRREMSGNTDITDSGGGTPAVGVSEPLKNCIIEKNGLRDGNRSVNHETIMTYFHVQKRPVVKT